jgi:hypothetical protein
VNAVLWLAFGFGTIVLVGTLLVAVHDAIARAIVAAPGSALGRPRVGSPRHVGLVSSRYQSAQLEGGGTPSARSKMYATAAANPAGRVSRCRAPGTFR